MRYNVRFDETFIDHIGNRNGEGNDVDDPRSETLNVIFSNNDENMFSAQIVTDLLQLKNEIYNFNVSYSDSDDSDDSDN